MAHTTTATGPVQRYKPTTGVAVGYLSLAGCAIVVGLVAASEHSVLGLRVVLGVLFGAVVIWAVLLRPRAAAYADTLVLQNIISDRHLPLARVDEVVVRQQLFVWVGDKRYACSGIGRSRRAMLGRRSRGPLSVIGIAQTDDRMGIGAASAIGDGADYATFVERSIDDLAQAARRSPAEPPPVRRVWAVREIAAMSVLGVVFALSFLL